MPHTDFTTAGELMRFFALIVVIALLWGAVAAVAFVAVHGWLS